MHFLDGLAGAAAGMRVVVPADGLTVGKRSENDVVLADDYVSRTHARFHVTGGALWLEDLGSTNGSFVNNIQVQHVRLTAGDTVRAGSSVFRYRDRPAAVVHSDTDVAVSAAASPGTVIRRLHSPPPLAPVSAPVPSGDDERALRYSAALRELARIRPGALSGDQALGRILEIVFTFLPIDRGCIVLRGEGDELSTPAVRFRDPARGKEDMPLSRTLLRRAIENRSALLIPDTSLDAGLASAASVIAQRLCCVAYVPLVFGDDVIGVLCLDTHVPGGLREEHLDELLGFANQAALVTYQARMQERIQSELERRSRLQRFLSRSVAEQYMESGSDPVLGGEEREITVLFADLRGFTTLAEKISPTEAVSLLNLVFERLGATILAQGGVLDKYIGDCVMALFGAPVGDEEHCLSAVRAALAMQGELAAVRGQLAARYSGLAIGVSINCGTAVVGNIGSELKMDYTAIGDVVNVAARIEDLAGPGEILITDSVATRIAAFVDFGPKTTLTLRGREQSTQVYAVIGMKAENQAT